MQPQPILHFWFTELPPSSTSSKTLRWTKPPVPHDADFRDALLERPGVQKTFDALGEEYTALDALWAKEADDRLDAYKRGELKAVALAAVTAKYPNLLTPAVGASD